MTDCGVRAYPDIATAWDRLREHCGPSFDESLTEFGACCQAVDVEFSHRGPDFYANSVSYLYELTHFHFSTFKDAFFDVVLRATADLGLVSIGDVGCGVGLDAQALATGGSRMTLYDFAGPSTRYAAWRFERDSQPCDIRSISSLGQERHDLVYAVDVLEHLPDPLPFVERLFLAGRFVCVNYFGHSADAWDGHDMHFPLNHRRLVPEFARHGELIELGVSGATVTALWRGRV